MLVLEDERHEKVQKTGAEDRCGEKALGVKVGRKGMGRKS
jgi:hypothetical protein